MSHKPAFFIEHGFLPNVEERGLIDRLNRVLFQFLEIHHIDSQGQQDHRSAEIVVSERRMAEFETAAAPT
jgi:hypothetical protein